MTTNPIRKNRHVSPAVIALLIQLASFSLVVACLSLGWHTFQFKLSFNQVLIFQAALTLLITRWFGLAWWWCVIQPCFPFALVLMLMLPVPSYLYLLLFLFFLVFYWSTYRTQVPYFPSTKPVWLAVEKLLAPDRPTALIDIGSGLGGLILFLAGRHVDGKFIGVEIAPLPWLVSHVRALFCKRGQAQFLRCDYEAMNFAEFDIVFAYLSPAAMPALWQKAKREMRSGTRLVSYEFAIPAVAPDLSINPEGSQADGAPQLFVWIM